MPHDSGIEGDGNEGYFASVSDLMVGVLFVFLLMLTVFALNYRDAERAQVVERQKYEQALRDLESARQNAQRQADANEQLRTLLRRAMAQLERDIEDREAARRRLLTSVEQALKDRGVRVYLDQRSGILRLSGDLLFATGSAVLGPTSKGTLQTLAEVLARILPCYTAASGADGCDRAEPVLETVLVEGHTDRQRFGSVDVVISQERNDRLSADRALSVFLELRRAQPGLDAMRNTEQLPLLGVSGYGERRPLPEEQCSADGNCPGNRRIDLRFVLSARSSDELRRMREEIEGALGSQP
jgi:flagellar motor protein MotB